MHERSESEQSAHEATQMVDNSSCCLEDTYEQRSSQEMAQPAVNVQKDAEASRQPEPARQERMQEIEQLPSKTKQVIQEVKQKVEEVRQPVKQALIIQERQENSPSPSKKRLSKDYLKGDSIFDILNARAKALLDKRQRTE